MYVILLLLSCFCFTKNQVLDLCPDNWSGAPRNFGVQIVQMLDRFPVDTIKRVRGCKITSTPFDCFPINLCLFVNITVLNLTYVTLLRLNVFSNKHQVQLNEKCP